MMKNLILIGVIVLTQSCSLLPYQEESACKFDGLGKCLPIDRAYKEAVSGINQGGKLVNGKKNSDLFWDTGLEVNNSNNQTATLTIEQDYQNSIYKQMRKLVQQPQMPLLKPATVRRVLILPYRSKNFKQWTSATYVYYIEKQPQWTLDKVNANQVPQNTLDLYQ